MNNYITALLLIAYTPYVAFLYIREHHKAIFISIAVVIGILSFVLYFGEENKTIKESNNNIIDLTAAFANGEKRKENVKIIAIHHTAGSPKGTINDIVKVHYIERGWGKIGYHFYIDKNGVVYQLRPLDERVPHAYGCNDNAIAICIAGNFSKNEVPTIQWEKALELTKKLIKQFNLRKTDVYKHSELTKFSAMNNTECAGAKFDMDKFRKAL